MNKWMVLALACSGCGAETLPAFVTIGPPAPEAGCERLLGRDALVQGALVVTEHPLDFAFDGPGWLVLSDGGEQVYTRLGALTLDVDGRLLSADGLPVLGFVPGQVGLSELQVSALTRPRPTSHVSIRANLNSDAPVQVFDPLSCTGTSQLQIATVLFDALGHTHDASLFWNKSARGTWEFHVMVDGSGLNGGTTGTPTEILTGSADFDTDGRLVSVNQSSNFDALGATSPRPIELDLGDATGLGGTGLHGVTQFASPSGMSFVAQDGAPFGTLVTISADQRGRLTGLYGNGTVETLGTLAVALFSAPEALHRGLHDVLHATLEAGDPMLVIAGGGGSGWLIPGALERLPKVSNSCVP